ncbi:MAG: PEP-CTERM sorting domain-containing protein, partial [Myxococcota bacterium]
SVQAVRSDDNSLVFDETLPISGTTVVWDSDGIPTGFGLGTLDDFEITLPTSGPYTLLQNYGSHDTVTVESVIISPAPGYSTLASLPIGAAQYSVTSGSLDVVAYYSAIDSTGANSPVLNVLAPISGTNTLVGTVQLVTGGLEIHVNNALMGTLPGAAFGETANLEITGDITWIGSVAAAIPEPSTGVLLALGLGLLAGRRTRR